MALCSEGGSDEGEALKCTNVDKQEEGHALQTDVSVLKCRTLLQKFVNDTYTDTTPRHRIPSNEARIHHAIAIIPATWPLELGPLLRMRSHRNGK